MFYSANGKFTKKSIKEGFLDVFHGYVHKHDETELDKIKSDINDIKDKANDLSDEFKSSKRNFYALYDKVSKSDEVQDKVDQKFSYLDEVQDEIDQKFSYLDEVQDEMEQQINEMNHFEENVGIGTPPHNDYKLDVNGNIKVDGTINANSGSELDAFTGNASTTIFQGNTNTQLRSNGGDISMYTKGPNAITEKMRIKGQGNVGIGTNTPKAGLQVYNNKGAIISSAIASGERTAVLRLGAPYAEDHDAYCAKITSTNNHSSNYNSDLRFYTHDSEKLGKVSGSNEPVPDAKERMSILSNGNVGIGASNPVGKLHTRLVKQVGKYKIRHHRSDGGYASKNIIHQNSHDAKSLYANRDNIDFISFVNSNTLYTHNMALHDATNWYELNLRYAHSGGELEKDFFPMETDYTIIAYQKQASAPAIIEGDIDQNISTYDPSHSNYSQLSIQSISETVNGGNRMALKIGADHNTKTGYLQTVSPFIHPFNLVLQPQNGNVGIGNTNPASKLHVVDNGPVTFASSTGINSGIYNIPGAKIVMNNRTSKNETPGDAEAKSHGKIIWTGHNRPKPSAYIESLHESWDDKGHLTFATSPGSQGAYERMRISSNGKVGIGNNNPSEKLEVNGKVKANEFCVGNICLTSADITRIKNL